MDCDGAVANTEDLIRLARLEAEGKMPAGFTQMSMMQTMRYLNRIVHLRIVFSVIPYPGPTVSDK
jgi:hypothetical protein